MNPILQHARDLTRRSLLGYGATSGVALSLGGTALQTLLQGPVDGCHHAPKAKRVIFLQQNGAPSHVDLFDESPSCANCTASRFRTASSAGGGSVR